MTFEATPRRTMAERLQRMMADRHRAAPGYQLYRVEATVPAVQYVQALSAEHAVATAVAIGGGWQVDTRAPIEDGHVVDVDVARADEDDWNHHAGEL